VELSWSTSLSYNIESKNSPSRLCKILVYLHDREYSNEDMSLGQYRYQNHDITYLSYLEQVNLDETLLILMFSQKYVNQDV
jgi:hypothetical protein